jgi:hypothetical protein
MAAKKKKAPAKKAKPAAEPAKKPKPKKNLPPITRVEEEHSPDELKDHPQNYYGHPDDQLEHIIESIRLFGIYRRIIVADDLTILAGHGVTKACRKMKLEKVPVLRLNIRPQDPRALKLLAGDNRISQLAEIDDRGLSELLKTVKEEDDLLGTGYDEKMLAALVMVTRHRGEVADMNEAAEWVGMPEFGAKDEQIKITVLFRNKKDRETFVKEKALKITTYKTETAWMTWWPPKERDDLESVKFITPDKKKAKAKK